MSVSAANETQLIPLEVLFGNPIKASPQISPDGKRIAYLAPSDGGQYTPERRSRCLGEHDPDVVPRRLERRPIVLIVAGSHHRLRLVGFEVTESDTFADSDAAKAYLAQECNDPVSISHVRGHGLECDS